MWRKCGERIVLDKIIYFWENNIVDKRGETK
jgi:hypothetical protein